MTVSQSKPIPTSIASSSLKSKFEYIVIQALIKIMQSQLNNIVC